jgi:hypothetical protein
VNDVLASVREIFPDEEPPERLGLLLEDTFSNQDGTGDADGPVTQMRPSTSSAGGVILEGVEVDVRVGPAATKIFGGGTCPGG